MPAALIQPVRRRRPRIAVLAPAVAAAALLAGCGGGEHTPSVTGLPLVSGARVLVQQKVCDAGTNAYCALEMVVRDSAYPNSRSLALAEASLLHKHHWIRVDAPIGLEFASDSPGDRLRVTYAGAPGELQAIDLGWVKRSRRLTLSLSREIFSHEAAMAVLLQLGTTP